MGSSSPLGQPYDHAIARLAAAGGDVSALPVPLQTLLLIESAQGIIDNGGLAFFYEADFPNNPPYSDFVEAYRRIGADTAAACIEQSAALFPFEEPHLFEELRLLWLERIGGELQRLEKGVMGDTGVWGKLAWYVDLHRDAFR